MTNGQVKQAALVEIMGRYGIETYKYPCNRTMYQLLDTQGLMDAESRLTSQVPDDLISINFPSSYGNVQITIIGQELAKKWAKERGRQFIHRVLVTCSCGELVPFGRLHQHKCKGE